MSIEKFHKEYNSLAGGKALDPDMVRDRVKSWLGDPSLDATDIAVRQSLSVILTMKYCLSMAQVAQLLGKDPKTLFEGRDTFLALAYYDKVDGERPSRTKRRVHAHKTFSQVLRALKAILK